MGAVSKASHELPTRLRLDMEELFSYRFRDVRVHSTPQTWRYNEQLCSRAFTLGQHIFLGLGQSAEDPYLIAHELAHVCQKNIAATRPASIDEQELEASLAAWLVTHGVPYRCAVPSGAAELSCWGEAGHYYTVYLTLLAAGLENGLAKDIAKFAQIGDEVAYLDATEQGILFASTVGKIAASAPRGSAAVDPKLLEQLRVSLEIQRGLHSLTGHPSAVETAQRAHILETPSKTPDNFAIGLGIHAFGDSFAHRDLENEALMYKAPVGHAVEIQRYYARAIAAPRQSLIKWPTWDEAMDHGHSPDYPDHRPKLYQQYGSELYAIARVRWKRRPLATLPQLRAALLDVSRTKGEERQIARIMMWAETFGAAISRNKSAAKRLYTMDVELETFRRDLAHFGINADHLKRARGYARAWATLGTIAPPRIAKVADYEKEAPPAEREGLAPGKGLDAMKGAAPQSKSKASAMPTSR